jgi:proline racemase
LGDKTAGNYQFRATIADNWVFGAGGANFALESIGFDITRQVSGTPTTTGQVVASFMIANVEAAPHPTIPALNGLAYVMFRAVDADGVIRTCTTLRPGRADRSPCGTGSNANMAVQYAEGRVTPGDVLISRSIIGGEFTTEFLGETTVGPFVATQNRVSGQCWIYAMTQIGFDPTDPFPQGFTLSDTWGG